MPLTTRSGPRPDADGCRGRGSRCNRCLYRQDGARYRQHGAWCRQDGAFHLLRRAADSSHASSVLTASSQKPMCTHATGGGAAADGGTAVGGGPVAGGGDALGAPVAAGTTYNMSTADGMCTAYGTEHT